MAKSRIHTHRSVAHTNPMTPPILSDSADRTGRVELKYVLPTVQLSKLFLWMRNHAHQIEPTHPERRICNLYFDSAELGCYAENLAGIAQREKFRARWSGILSNIRAGSLEIKSKVHGLGFKTREPLSEEIFLDGQGWKGVVRSIKKQLPESGPHAEALAKHPVPTIMNSYMRKYYQISGTPLRITVDTEHTVYAQLFSSRVNVRRPLKLWNDTIVELKLPPDCVPWVHTVVEGLPVIRSRNSKYVQGLGAVL